MDEKNLSETEGMHPPVGGSGESTLGDSSKIGRYRIICHLGQGGFGRVYLAHDDDLDRQVAIKVPTPERINGLGSSIPFFKNPSLLMKMFTGETADLVTWDIPKLVLNLPYYQPAVRPPVRAAPLPRNMSSS